MGDRKKRMFYSFGKGMAYELTNGKLIKLKFKNKNNEGVIKFVSYSNKIKPEIEKNRAHTPNFCIQILARNLRFPPWLLSTIVF